MRKQSFIIEACHMPCTVVGCHLLCSGLCLARGVVLQLFVQTYHRLLSAFWHFYNQCLFNSFRQVIWLECESKVSNEEGQDTGSGVYHPCLNVLPYINPRGVGITNTITCRARSYSSHNYSRLLSYSHR